jgi:hypothetical protein
MDDDLQNLEHELKEFRPVAPSRALTARIESELVRDIASPTQASPAWWLWAAALPVAAVLAVMAAIAMQHEPANNMNRRSRSRSRVPWRIPPRC